MVTRMRQRRDTAANWASENPVLQLGEMGYDTTNHQVRIGDGVTPWTGLRFAAFDSVPAAVPRVLTEDPETVILLDPDDPDRRGIVIRDNPDQPRNIFTAYSLFGVHDYLNVPIFIVPPAGGPKVFGDRFGVYTGVFDRAIGFEPHGSLTIGETSVKRVFFCTQEPLDAETVDQMNRMNTGGFIGGVHTLDYRAKVGDVCISTGGHVMFWRCLTAGTWEDPEGAWVPVTESSSLTSVVNHSTTGLIEVYEEFVYAYGTITLTLPNPAALPHGRKLVIKNGGTGAVTVAAHAGTIVDGAATRTLAGASPPTPGAALTLVALTTFWAII